MALTRTVELLESSDDSPWSEASAGESTRRVRKVLRKLESGKGPGIFQRFILRWLYSPTGPIQEISMSNGWSQEYLALAQTVDEYLNPMNSAPNKSFQADRDPRERGSRPLNSNR